MAALISQRMAAVISQRMAAVTGQRMAAVTSRMIKDDGTPDSVWLPWLALQSIAPVEMRSLCADDCRLVVVAPHPDDEVLSCGGLLAMRAACGLQSLVIAVTDGEASHDGIGRDLGLGNSSADRRNPLGMQRQMESSAGLQMLGLRPSTDVHRLGIADGQAMRCEQAITELLLKVIKPSDVLVTTWQFDGHPDHEAAGRAASRAASAAGCRLVQAPVWMWHWAEPNDARVPWHKLSALALPGTAVQAKQRALQCHRSQLEARSGQHGPVLMPSIVQRASRAQEYFFE